MSTTKNGRIRKLLAKNVLKKPSVEAAKPYMPTTWRHTETVLDKDKKPSKRKVEIQIVINTNGRNKRREVEAERLLTALSGDSKKSRMRKFAHKKQKAEKTPTSGKKKK